MTALAWKGASLAATLVLAAAVRWTPPAAVADLRPRPDALEYEESARNLSSGEGYCLRIRGTKYAPHYPFGFPALIAATLWVLGDETGGGVRAVLGAALVTVAGSWTLGLAVGGVGSATAAGLVVALSPLHVGWSRHVMSDVPASAAVAVLAAATLLVLRRGSTVGACVLLGVGCGLATTIRQTTVFLLPAVAVALAWSRFPLRALAAFGVGVGIGLLPGVAYGALRLGSPFATGYEGWVPERRFGLRYVLDTPRGGGHETNLWFYAQLLAGMGPLYPWPIAVLVLAGMGLALRRTGAARWLAIMFAISGAALLGIHLPFFWQWDRFLLPLLPLLAGVAALPFTADAPRALRALAFALGVAAIVLVARQDDPYAPPRDPGEVTALRAIAARVEPDAALMVRTNAFFFERILRDRADRVWMPIGLTDDATLIATALRPYALDERSATWTRAAVGVPTFEAGAATRAVGTLLAEGRPVYFADVLREQTPVVRAFRALLTERFAVRLMGTVGRFGLYRVRGR